VLDDRDGGGADSFTRAPITGVNEARLCAERGKPATPLAVYVVRCSLTHSLQIVALVVFELIADAVSGPRAIYVTRRSRA
jgi:hypothetical protein